jgi:hypothetical protein
MEDVIKRNVHVWKENSGHGRQFHRRTDSLIRAYHSDESSILGQLKVYYYKLFTQIHVKQNW